VLFAKIQVFFLLLIWLFAYLLVWYFFYRKTQKKISKANPANLENLAEIVVQTIKKPKIIRLIIIYL
jgi:membrane protein implicated in regulation of membrane protease activity